MNLLSPEYEKWGRTVKKALIDKKMTVTALAGALHMPRVVVSYLLGGKRVNKEAARRISEYLGIPAP